MPESAQPAKLHAPNGANATGSIKTPEPIWLPITKENTDQKPILRIE
jgi:hypothetical protein